MKNLTKTLFIVGLCLTVNTISNAQNVGVNATGAAPSADAMLDISATNKGLLIPRISIPSLTLIGPVTGGATTSLLVYNTNAATGLGYHYWDGNDWIPFSTGGNDWKIIGNSNTTSGTHFLGTTNAQALDFRTGNTLRFRVANADQVHAMSLGTTGLPFYSFGADPNTGMWSSTADFLNFSTAGTEKLELGTTEAVFNDLSANYDLRVESNGNANMLFVDGGTDKVGIGKAAPTEVLDVQGNLRFSGALMPNNNAGVLNRALLSQGAGVPPIWSGFTFLNTPAISNIGKYYSTLSWTGTWTNGTALTFTINDPNLVCGTQASQVSVNFYCSTTTALSDGLNIRNVRVAAGSMRITVVNNSGGNWTGAVPIVYTAFY